jgi:hypothetical protein
VEGVDDGATSKALRVMNHSAAHRFPSIIFVRAADLQMDFLIDSGLEGKASCDLLILSWVIIAINFIFTISIAKR